MRAVVTTLAHPRGRLQRAVPRGWDWLAALLGSLGLWWALIRLAGLAIGVLFG